MTKIKLYIFLAILFFSLGTYLFISSSNNDYLDIGFNKVYHIESYDNFYDTESNKFKGKERTDVELYYYEVGKDFKSHKIRAGFDVRTVEGIKIIEIDRLYDVNTNTGKHLIEDKEIYLFAPKGDHQKSFEYYHINYDNPVNMSFQGKESFYGYALNKFQGKAVTDQTKYLSHLDGVPEEKNVRVLSDIVMWVDPLSGYMVKYKEVASASLYDAKTGAYLMPWNNFTNEVSDISVEKNVLILKDKKLDSDITGIFIPFLFACISISMIFLARLEYNIYRLNNV